LEECWKRLRAAAGRKEALMVADTGIEGQQKDTSGKREGAAREEGDSSLVFK
jgi:hypothetical protein